MPLPFVPSLSGGALCRDAERLLDAFDAAWQDGGPSVADFLSRLAPCPQCDGEARARLLQELIKIDLEYRWRRPPAGRPLLEQYAVAFPELGPAGEWPASLIGEEYRARHCWGDRPGHAEYAARFPGQAADVLAELARIDSALAARMPAPASPSSAATLPESPAARRPGLPAVAGYTLLEEVGRGGMGVVYRAEQHHPRRVVALKMIVAGEHAGAEQVKRFRAEADAVARLCHPNVVQVYEAGVANGLPYLTLEFMAGGSLTEKLAGVPQPPRGAAELVEVLARAIHYAHGQGVVHRDLKPANVLLAGDGTPKITDFGLAKHLDGGAPQTETGSILGTAGYMSPEQASGRTREIGPLSDVYGLGAILYELLTGRAPFAGATPLDTLEQVRSQEPVPPTRLQPKVPRDLETICLKCLEKEPSRRYAGAQQLADDLRRFVEGKPTAARPVGPVGKAVKWARRRPAVAGLLATILLAVAAAFLVISWELGQKEAALRQKDEALKEAAAMNYFYLILRADADRRENNVAGAEARLAECPPALREWEWYYLSRLCRGWLLECPVKGAAAHAVDVSADGRRLVAGYVDGSVRVWDAADGRLLLERHAHESGVRAVAFSRDGRHLASSDEGGTVRLWDADTGKEKWRADDQNKDHSAKRPFDGLAFSPDGTYLAEACRSRTVRIHEVADGSVAQTLPDCPDHVLSLAYSPDGRRLAAGCDGLRGEGRPDDPTVVVWDTTTWEPVCRFGEHRHGVTALAFSPNGRWLASGDRVADQRIFQTGELRVWEPEGPKGPNVRSLPGHTDSVTGVAFSPDGSRLVSSGREGAVRVWDLDTSREIFAIRGRKALFAARYTPDGRRLVAACEDGALRVWDADRGQGPRALFTNRNAFFSVAFSGDGKRLASGHADGTVKVWDVRGGRLAWSEPPDGEQIVFGVAFSPDGRRVASAEQDGMVRVRDAGDGKELWSVRAAREKRVHGVAFSPDSLRLASAGEDGTVKLWDAAGRELHAFRGPQAAALCVAFSPDGRLLAAGWQDGTLRVWDAASNEEVFASRAERSEIKCLAFSPDGRFLASASDSDDPLVTVWDVRTWKEARTWRDDGRGITGLAFSKSGERLATSSSDKGMVKLWETRTGRPVLTLTGHEGATNGVTFSRDGNLLATAGWDFAARIWDATPMEGAAEP